jgi:hypothetical protein
MTGRLLALALLALLPASAEEAPTGDPRLLEAERLFSVAEFDRALPLLGGMIEELLVLSDTLSGQGRHDLARALDLSAQIRFSLGETEEARQDLARLVQTDPAYALNEERVSPRLARLYADIRKARVGTLTVTGSPADAEVFVEGRSIGRTPLLQAPVLAGELRLRVGLIGYDPSESVVTVAAGEEQAFEYDLMPNARDLHIRTDPPEVTVLLDGREVGVTERDSGRTAAFASRPLILQAIEPGRHELVFRRECFVEERRSVEVDIDLQDNAPMQLEPVSLRRSRTTLALSARPERASFLLDGEEVGTTPLTHPVCPGPRSLELRVGGRTVWFEHRRFGPDEQVVLEAWARPTLALSLPAGLREQVTPEELSALFGSAEPGGGFNLAPPTEKPAPGAGASHAEVRAHLEERRTDLLLLLARGESPVRRQWEVTLWHRESPVPDRRVLPGGGEEELAAYLEEISRPWPWTRPWAGAVPVDRPRGLPVLGPLDPGGPAEAAGLLPGDRLLGVGEEEIARASDLDRLVGEAEPGSELALRVRRGGEDLEILLSVSRAVQLPGPSERLGRHALLLARAETGLVSLEDPLERAAASLGLASALMRGGRWEEALEALQGLKAPAGADPAGLVAGSAAFLEGLCLERLGYRKEAAAAYRRAAALPAARLLGPEGPPLAEAARLRAELLGG